MSAGHEKMEAGKAVEHELRRQASNADFRRDLGHLPQFRVDHELPERLASLLGDLDRTERRFYR